MTCIVHLLRRYIINKCTGAQSKKLCSSKKKQKSIKEYTNEEIFIFGDTNYD